MTQDEILSAAKEAGCNDEFIKMAPCWLENYAGIIERVVERKTIERCAVECESWKFKTAYSRETYVYNNAINRAAAAIRKLGEE